MKFQTILIIFTVVSLTLAAWFFNSWRIQKQENARINNNFSAVVAKIKAENFKNVQVLQMTVKEIKNSFPDLEKKLKQEFDIKLRNVQVVSNTVTTVNHTFKTTIKDSIRLDSIPVQKITFKDAWLDFEAEKAGKEFFVNRNIQTVPLIQVVHRDKFRLKYLFKKRPLFQDVKSDNPFAEIKFNRVIEISK